MEQIAPGARLPQQDGVRSLHRDELLGKIEADRSGPAPIRSGPGPVFVARREAADLQVLAIYRADLVDRAVQPPRPPRIAQPFVDLGLEVQREDLQLPDPAGARLLQRLVQVGEPPL